MHGLVCIGTSIKNIDDLKDQKKKTEVVEVKNEAGETTGIIYCELH